MNSLRFVMLLSLAAWLGALIFFPIVAQSSFAALPSAHLAGLVVRGSLLSLHWLGVGCGLIFVAASLGQNRYCQGFARPGSASHILVALMLVLTAISQFKIIPRMDALRLAAGEISSLPANDPVRVQFDSLHVWSTRLEGIVLVLGLVVLYLTSRRLART